MVNGSLNIRFDFRGYPCQFTLRGESGAEVLPQLEAITETLEKLGASPNGKSVDETAWCTIHNCEMKRRTKNGKVWYSHKVGDKYCKGGNRKK